MLIAGDCRAYVRRDPVDMRNGIDGLSRNPRPRGIERQADQGSVMAYGPAEAEFPAASAEIT